MNIHNSHSKTTVPDTLGITKRNIHSLILVIKAPGKISRRVKCRNLGGLAVALYTKTRDRTRRARQSHGGCHEEWGGTRGFSKIPCLAYKNACRIQKCDCQWQYLIGRSFSATLILGVKEREEWIWEEMVGRKKKEVSDQPVDRMNQ